MVRTENTSEKRCLIYRNNKRWNLCDSYVSFSYVEFNWKYRMAQNKLREGLDERWARFLIEGTCKEEWPKRDEMNKKKRK